MFLLNCERIVVMPDSEAEMGAAYGLGDLPEVVGEVPTQLQRLVKEMRALGDAQRHMNFLLEKVARELKEARGDG